jgi:hypothetical protein
MKNHPRSSAFICGQFIFPPPYKHIRVHQRSSAANLSFSFFSPNKHISVYQRPSAANLSFIFAPFWKEPFGKYLSHFLA